MVRSKVDAIFAGIQPALQSAAGTGIPVIIAAVNFDPIAHGYVQSLARPGGSVTGVVLRQTELAEKQVELLTQAFPERNRLAMQWDAISADQFSAAEHRAKTLGLDVISIRFERRPYDFSAAFRKMAEGGAQMLLTLSSPFSVQSLRPSSTSRSSIACRLCSSSGVMWNWVASCLTAPTTWQCFVKPPSTRPRCCVVPARRSSRRTAQQI